mmetsp:Transcript_33166/g.83902  ORF Transcript_33166/g.83902 Transcript_33166/m.83902 type:complete len:207 (+) Transcript_33166:233-853(+)
MSCFMGSSPVASCGGGLPLAKRLAPVPGLLVAPIGLPEPVSPLTPKLPAELGAPVEEAPLAREEPLGVKLPPAEAPETCSLRCSGEEPREDNGVVGAIGSGEPLQLEEPLGSAEDCGSKIRTSAFPLPGSLGGRCFLPSEAPGSKAGCRKEGRSAASPPELDPRGDAARSPLAAAMALTPMAGRWPTAGHAASSKRRAWGRPVVQR